MTPEDNLVIRHIFQCTLFHWPLNELNLEDFALYLNIQTAKAMRRLGSTKDGYKSLNECRLANVNSLYEGHFRSNKTMRATWHDPIFKNNASFCSTIYCVQNLISSQSLNIGGRRGTTDDVATIPFHPPLSSAALRESPNPIAVHSLMLSSHLFFCLPLLLAPFTVPCRTVFDMPEDLEMWPYHLSFLFFTIVRRSSCTPIAFWILLRTSSFVTWSL